MAMKASHKNSKIFQRWWGSKWIFRLV